MMKDQDKTKEQLISELGQLRRQNTELEAARKEQRETNQRLVESEEKYRSIVELAPDGIITVNKKGVITSSNQAFLSLTGFSSEEIVRKHFTKLPTLRARDIPKYVSLFASVLRGKQPKPFDFTWVHKDGTHRTGEAHISLMKANSHIIGVQAIARDITERKRMEEKIRSLLEDESKLAKEWQELFDASSDVMALISPDFEILRINRVGYEGLGKKREEIIGKKCYEVVHGLDSPINGCPCKEVIRTKKAEVGEITQGGRHYIATASPVLDENNELKAFAHTIKDITERKQAEEELKKFKTFADNGKQGDSITSLKDEKLLYVNEAYAQMHGYGVDELIGKHYSVVYNDEQFKVVERLRNKILQASSHFTTELWRKKKDGTIFATLTTSTVIKDDGAEPLFIVSTLIDITERKRTDEILKESEERYRALVDLGANFDEAIIMTQNTEKGDGIHTFVNDEWSRITGYSKEELIGMPYFNLIHPKDREATMDRYERRLNGEIISSTLEFSIIRKDGTEVPVEAVGGSTTYQGKRAAVGYFRDITERKRAEEALRESEARLTEAQAVAHIGNWAWDLRTNELIWSKENYRIFGLSHEVSPSYENFEKTIHPEDREFVNKSVEAALKRKRPYDIDFRIVLPSGEERTVHAIGKINYDNEGQPIRFFGTVQDITERKKKEEEIRKFKTISDNAGYGVAIGTPEGNIIYINESLAQMHGYEPDELVGKHFSILYPEEQAKGVEEFRNNLMQGSTNHWVEEIWRKKKDGTIFPSITTGIITRDDDGKPLFLSAGAIDITERKKMEEQLRQSQLLASLGEMTAGIAHEVNNPLSSILLYSELLTESDIPREVKKDIRIIHNEARRASKIMTGLLAYGRKEQPKMHRVDLHKILRKVLSMRKYREKVQNIRLSSNLLEGPLYVKGDLTQLMQVFMNLVINAEEALGTSNGGNIIINTKTDKEWAKISIADDGTGIPEENLNQIFHPFFTTKPTGQGTGLGLSTCYGIITAHNGLIRAENNKMGGATFTVELPAS